MDAERIAERGLILYETDAATCEGCGIPAPPEAAADPGWFIDSELVPGPVEPITIARLRCPACW